MSSGIATEVLHITASILDSASERRRAPRAASWRIRPPEHDKSIFGDVEDRPGIAGTAYDTAWLAGVSDRPGITGGTTRQHSRFPTALAWLIEHQQPDGSWGGAVRYEHDRMLSTLAALATLTRFGRRDIDREAVAAGTRYLWQHGHRLAAEPMELVGFELLLPTLVRRAQQAGVAVPPDLDTYAAQRAEKLRLIPKEALYSPFTTAVHSLEFLGDDADTPLLQRAQGANGAIGNSPAATAFYYERSRDPRALTYLEESVARCEGGMAPVLYPCETFELLWSAYHLFLAGVPARQLLSIGERAALADALRHRGVSLSPTFPIPDADDTAVALLLLHELGDAVQPGVLEAFQTKAGHFASFPHERHSSVGVNVHVLHALLRVPGYPNAAHIVDQLVEYLAAEQVRGQYWIDKWHISPYYATSHALCVLRELPPAVRQRTTQLEAQARDWIRQTQNSDGSWGFYSEPTAEETAYALLALAPATSEALPGSGDATPAIAYADRRRCAAAARYLRQVAPGMSAASSGKSGAVSARPDFPPMWIDKCLYTPTLVVQAVIQSALIAYAQWK